MFKKRVLYCDICSWAGISFNAEHYYGKIKFQNDKKEPIELQYPLTESQAIYLNKKNSCFTMISRYKVGSLCKNFNNKEDIYAASLLYMKQNNLFNKYDFLIEGDGDSCPVYIIWAKNEKVKNDLNEIYNQWDKISFSRSQKSDFLMDSWEDLARKYNLIIEFD